MRERVAMWRVVVLMRLLRCRRMPVPPKPVMRQSRRELNRWDSRRWRQRRNSNVSSR